MLSDSSKKAQYDRFGMAGAQAGAGAGAGRQHGGFQGEYGFGMEGAQAGTGAGIGCQQGGLVWVWMLVTSTGFQV